MGRIVRRSGVVARHVVSDLQPKAVYDLLRDGRRAGSFKADGEGRIEFKSTLGTAKPQRFELLMQSATSSKVEGLR